MRNRFLRFIVCLFLILFGSSVNTWSAASADQAKIVFIPVKGQIEPGLANFIERSIKRAEHLGAEKIVLEIDTPGGLIDSAKEIKKAVFGTKLPTVAFVSGEAKSAGVLIALSAEYIYMAPGSSIGAAEPRPNTEKILSSWRSDLESAAEARGRNQEIVAGMADQRIKIENIKEPGKLLSLSAQRAVELGIADKVIGNRDALLSYLAEQDGVYYEVVETKPGWGETLAWWLINPLVSPILLTIGFLGLITEAFMPGWGIGGIVGLIGLALYFGGHMLAGVTGWLPVLVFFLGIIAVLLEIFVIPGFGAAGLIGGGLIIWSIFLSSTSPVQAVITLIVAGIGSVVSVYVMVKVLGKKGFWHRLILGTMLDTGSGYTAPKKELEKYLGLEGTAITPLRPAGSADLGGQRVDVVSEGGFVSPGSRVKVVLVEGGRVVVRPVDESEIHHKL